MRFFLPLLIINLLLVSFTYAAEQVAFWHFGTEETSKLKAVGGVNRDQKGPRPPVYPDFDANNTAVRMDGGGARFVLEDTGANSKFDFTLGDSITLEAWVQVTELRPDENVYIIGKGRTYQKGFSKENQNWALRLRESDGNAKVSFLFFSKGEKDKPGNWHRWTSKEGFSVRSGWHHVAVSYTFGNSESVAGWLDGKKIAGVWDMGGATNRAPVVDDDSIWIGSSMGGSSSNSFRGYLDEIGVHRGILSDDVLKSRFRRVGQDPLANKPDALIPVVGIPKSGFKVDLHEGWTLVDGWPASTEELKSPLVSYEVPYPLFHRIPVRYDAWGIRDSWQGTVVLRSAGEIMLPMGEHMFLVRSKGASRIWLDGKLVAKTPPHARETGGHEQVQPVPASPAPGQRPTGYGDHETKFTVQSMGKPIQLVFESLVGGKKWRHEPGECCIAVKLQGENEFKVLQGKKGETPPALNDYEWEKAVEYLESKMLALDDQIRKKASQSQDAYWAMRKNASLDWAKNHTAPKVPQTGNWPVQNEVDQFLGARLDVLTQTAKGGQADEEFHGQVLPLLREQCFRCHAEKTRGGYRLNTREELLKAGDSGKAGVVPGDIAKSHLLDRIRPDASERMPPNGKGLDAKQVALLERWIKAGAKWPAEPVDVSQLKMAPTIDDMTFLRRAYLDTVGVPPTAQEIRIFVADLDPSKRARVIDKLLADPRYADHWISYWQDILAENPNILKPTLNNSGPFRFFLHEALKDDRPLDRMVTELIMMRGAMYQGGSAGFALAADNDVPMAAKAHIVGTAFLGLEMQCARCHDAPFHSISQKDLFQLSAMLDRKALVLPKSSTVPAGFFEKKERESLIKASLKPNQKIEPMWPFKEIFSGDVPEAWLLQKDDNREKLAAMITSPENKRFARVMANRYWKKLMGAGLVEPAFDWENKNASHPELLEWLSHQLIASGFQPKQLIRIIMNSNAYQREALGSNLASAPEKRYFLAPERRRMSAEQVVDTLFSASGRKIRVEEITFDADGRQSASVMLNLGVPRRAWEFTSLSNERDRPSLALPRNQAVIDVLEAFGWRGARQNPATDREESAHLLQPAILANGTLSTWIGRLTPQDGLTRLAIEAENPTQIADELYLQFLGRLPTEVERENVRKLLEPGFSARVNRQVAEPEIPETLPRLPRISWTNHLVEEATQVKLEMEKRAKTGDAPTRRLDANWRERMEDVVWAVFNLPEFVWIP